MISADKTLGIVSREEENQIARRMILWANSFPGLPDNIYDGAILYEQLVADEPCMALSTIQGTYITKRDILGGHEAEYQYKIIYRIKPGSSMDERLKADELLDKFGDWALSNLPDLGNGMRVVRNEPTTRSALFDAYDNGDEDHQILMKLTYEVI